MEIPQRIQEYLNELDPEQRKFQESCITVVPVILGLGMTCMIAIALWGSGYALMSETYWNSLIEFLKHPPR